MPEKHLHVISFDVPYPPDYGGVIDVYYKLMALHRLGFRIHLHCFSYGRTPWKGFEKICEEVHYYPRRTGALQAVGIQPYIVKSRKSEALISNLLNDNHPIIFEGLHSCYYLNDKRLSGRFRIYRESNIEHRYYFELALAERNLLRKFYHLIESMRLHFFQPTLRHAQLMLAVSEMDAAYLKSSYPDSKVVHLPCFHSNDSITILPGKGSYVLYHGNLSVAENQKAAAWLIKNVFSILPVRVVIAGHKPPQRLRLLALRYDRIEVLANPGDQEMDDLIRNAHVHVLYTHQATGLKLKLLNALFKGRYVVANQKMLEGTGLESTVIIANAPRQMQLKIIEAFDKEFSQSMIEKRKAMLNITYSNHNNARRLEELISGNG